MLVVQYQSVTGILSEFGLKPYFLPNDEEEYIVDPALVVNEVVEGLDCLLKYRGMALCIILQIGMGSCMMLDGTN